MGSIVCQHARIGAAAMLAAGSVVSERVEIAASTLAAGVPAAQKKQLSGASMRWTATSAAAYHVLRDRHLLTTATTQENP
jgi:carbonic anhydrase/acetyltransferase-like protein (isoleucine patch superfamily)